MKGTEKIVAHILAEAQQQADTALAQSQKVCDEIRATYAAQAEAEYRRILEEGKRENAGERIVRTARMEARQELLKAKQEEIDAVFAAARQKVEALPPEQAISFLARLAAEASLTGDEEIVLAARDRSAIGSAVADAANALLREAGKPASLQLAAENGAFSGGLILRRGKIEANCTTELLFSLDRDALSAQVAAILFAEGENPA